MPQARISNLVPAGRISNLIFNLKISSRAPTSSTSRTRRPIGLLLALTYSKSQTILGPSDLFRPHIRIINI